MSDPLPFYLCIAGPTASGKTNVALELAQRWSVEIISVDSALVYRGMDIGSSKPSLDEQKQVAHHLIDIRDPLEAYSAAEFVHDCKQLIYEIHARQRIPLLVGGTMLYFKALIEGLDDLPAANADIRKQLDREAKQLGWPAMHARLAEVDPLTATRLKANDSQRIQRALEVWLTSGKPLSSYFGQKKATVYPPMLSLEPQSRLWLHQRIEQRFKQMLAVGFLDEVRTLMSRKDLHANLPALRAVGYRQAWEALSHTPEQDDTQLKQQLMHTGVVATRQLAKRQITWLRAMPYRDVVHGDDPHHLEKAIQWFEIQLAQNQVCT